MVDLSFSINLKNTNVSAAGNSQGLTYFVPTGLELLSGLDVPDGYAYSLFGNDAYTNGLVDRLEGFAPQTMTTAQFANLHLVQGEKLAITYDYIPADRRHDDFAFSL